MRDTEGLLYAEIAESIRRLIVSGGLKPGDQLLTVREQAARWSCTPGTVGRAYALLADEGLLVAHRGAGTRVAPGALHAGSEPWRWATLVNQAERFLLDAVHAGHKPEQVEAALSLAIARWDDLRDEQAAPRPPPSPVGEMRFVGSHDLMIEMLPKMFGERCPGVHLHTEYVGSLGGLIALARGEADLAGIHLWDEASDVYNVPFVRRVLPGRRMLLLTLFHRSLGLIVQPGNPLAVEGLADLSRPGIRFVNRQAGSGTRVWLDVQLHEARITSDGIAGYDTALPTHLAVARAIAEGMAEMGLGIQAAADAFGLDFIPLTQEQYDLVFPEHVWNGPAGQALAAAVGSEEFAKSAAVLRGYDLSQAGRQVWVE